MLRSLFGACAVRLVTATALVAFGTQCLKRGVPPPAETVMATASFADGFTVEVLRVELAKTMGFQRERSGFWPEMLSQKESATLGGAGIDVMWQLHNDSFIAGRMGFQNNHDPVLMLLIRCQKDGVDWETDDFLAEGRRHQVGRKGDRISGLPSFGDTTEELEKMALRLEVEDGAGGWRDMVGPLKPALRDPRAIAGVDAFPRRKPELKIRLLHLDQPPVELSIPNPGYQASFPALPLSKLPMLHEDEEFTLRVEVPAWKEYRPGASFLDWRGQLEYRSVPDGCLDLQTKLYDETGNRLLWSARNFGLDFLPSERLGRLVCEVKRQAGIYPWRESEVTIVATGVMRAKVSEQSAVVTEEGRRLGCTKIVFREPKSHNGMLAASDRLAFVVLGEGSAADVKLLWSDHDTSSGLAVFTGGERSAGKSSSAGWGHKILAKTAATFEIGSHWEGQLKPSQPFRIGLIRQHTPKVVQFVHEVPPNPFLPKP